MIFALYRKLCVIIFYLQLNFTYMKIINYNRINNHH
jgi:hypothetical protein